MCGFLTYFDAICKFCDMLLLSAIRWIWFDFSIQWTLGKWKHWETFRLLSPGYFHESCRLFLLQNAFTKQVTFQGPVLPSAEYFQQRAQVPSQRDLGSKVLFGIRFSSKEVSGFPFTFRKVNLSTAKPSLQDFLLSALSSFCSTLALETSLWLAEFFSLLCRELHPCTQGNDFFFKSCLPVSKSLCPV